MTNNEELEDLSDFGESDFISEDEMMKKIIFSQQMNLLLENKNNFNIII